jgi:hypothetical protein
MQALIERVDAELLIMQGKEEEYEALLRENTQKFVEVCEGLVGNVDYATMKRIVGEASQYFYTMSVDIASVQDAISIYKVRRDEIKAKEEMAETFALLTECISLNSADVLAEIIECSTYVDKLDRDVEGVDESIMLFETRMAEYDLGVKEANEDIMAYNLAVIYQRNTSGFGSFITLIIENMIGSLQ